MSKAWYDYSYIQDFAKSFSWATYPVNGVDIPMPTDTPITAIFSGTISELSFDSSGGTLIIKIDDTTQSRGLPYYGFSHLDAIDLSFKIGSHVNQNQFLAFSGGQNIGQSLGKLPFGYNHHYTDSNFSSGPHLLMFLSETSYLLNQTSSKVNPYWLIPYIQNINKNKNNTNSVGSLETQYTINNDIQRNYTQITETSSAGDILLNIDKSLILYNPFDATKNESILNPVSWFQSFFGTFNEDIIALVLRFILIILGIMMIYEALNIAFNLNQQISTIVDKSKSVAQQVAILAA